MRDWRTKVDELLREEKNKIVTIDFANKTVSYTDKIKRHRKVTALTGDEEIARAYLVNRLVNVLDYKAELIELEKEYEVGRPKIYKPRIDVILKDSNGNPFFFIECKAPDKFETDKKYIEGQLYQLAKLEGKLKYLVYYTIDYQVEEIIDKAVIIEYEKFPEYTEWEKAGFPSFGDELSPGYSKPQKPPLKKGDPKYDLRRNINRDEVTSLATNLHNVLWGGGGTSDTEIFYSLVNIILSKIQDESEKEDGHEYDFQIYAYGDNIENPEKVFERVNQLYRRALKEKLNVINQNDIDEARVIDRNKFPLNKLVYTVQTLENYSFLEGRSSLDGRDILGDFFETITRDGFKQTKGQFFTPTAIIKFILYALKIDQLAIDRLNNDRELPFIMDPAAGSGTFLIESMKIITKEVKYKQRDKIKTSRQVEDRFHDFFMPDHKENRWAEKFIYGADINFDLGTATKVNMILHGDGSANIFVKDGLLSFRSYQKAVEPNYLNIQHGDKLYKEKEVNAQFDLVASNPPFSVDLENETKRTLNISFLFGDKKNSENLFIERWYQLLKEGGRLGVVLPESVFDTTENKYIRLFLFKYFWIKAVVSLPQLTFEPYTSTKTSLLFAQKKTTKDVEQWNELWEQYGKEWGQLKTRVENYINVFIEGKEQDKYPSIKGDIPETIKVNILRFLKDYITEEDKGLDIKGIIEKYQDEINEISKYDKDTQDVFGFYNTHWVFGEVAKHKTYPIFMADAQNVGYKRTKRGEKPMPNDLYDTEVAPQTINKSEIIENYNDQIKRKEALRIELETEKTELSRQKNGTKKVEKRLVQIAEDLEKLTDEIKRFINERDEVKRIIDQYYRNGRLKAEYWDRTDPDLLSHFENGLLQSYKSDDVMLRRGKVIKILDAIRKGVLWA